MACSLSTSPSRARITLIWRSVALRAWRSCFRRACGVAHPRGGRVFERLVLSLELLCEHGELVVLGRARRVDARGFHLLPIGLESVDDALREPLLDARRLHHLVDLRHEHDVERGEVRGVELVDRDLCARRGSGEAATARSPLRAGCDPSRARTLAASARSSCRTSSAASSRVSS